MLCNRCGHSIPAGASVCPHCQADAQPSSMSSMRPTSLKPPSFSGGASSSSPPESSSQQQPPSFQFTWNTRKQDEGTASSPPTSSFQFTWNQPKPPPEPQAETPPVPPPPAPEPQAKMAPTPAPPPSIVPPVSPTMASAVRPTSTPKPRANQDAPTTDLDPEKPTTDLNPEEPTSDQRPEDDDDESYAPPPARPPRVLRPANEDAADVSDRPPRVLRPAAVEYEEDNEPYALSENEPPARGMEDFAPQPAFQPKEGGQPPKAPSLYLFWAIFNCFCCMNPIGGILGIYLYCKANACFKRGDYARGMRLSDATMIVDGLTTLLSLIFGFFSNVITIS
ncbi:MAG: CD225/dispanin family protein [Oligosphaeraceae bacterium]